MFPAKPFLRRIEAPMCAKSSLTSLATASGLLRGTKTNYLRIPTIVGMMDMPLSGREMLRLYLQAGWVVLRQKGSHVVMGKGELRETIPMHRELKRGLERALL